MRSLLPGKAQKRRVRLTLLFALLFFLLLPCLAGAAVGGGFMQAVSVSPVETFVELEQAWGVERIPVEEYLEGMMAASIPAEYERETLKAQAVMLRSWCMSLSVKEEGDNRIAGEALEPVYLSEAARRKSWGDEYEENSKKIREILAETKGLILVEEGRIVAPPFFRVSSGRTRVVQEYQAESKQWDYLISLSCPTDVEAGEYLGRVEIHERDFQKKVGELLEEDSPVLTKIVLIRDTADYVKAVRIGEKTIGGEAFRQALGLASSCFTLEKNEDVIVIKTRGMGHGFGFSQYQANRLAGEGQDYRQLLAYFFPPLRIEKV